MRPVKEIHFAAPQGGWVQSGNITVAKSGQAEVLDNFFPTAQGAKLRGGSSTYATIGTAVVRLMVYSGATDDLYASTAAGIYDADRINGGGATFADVSGLTSGDWSSVQISTAGGRYLIAVNGSDHAQYYNGTSWFPITTVSQNNLSYDALTSAFTVGSTLTGGTSGATATLLGIVQASATTGTLRLGAITGTFQDNETISGSGGSATVNGTASSGSTIAITGVATNTLNQVWSHKERLFFVKESSLSAWYLPVESVGGAATELPLGSVFRKGGELLFGAAWSLDSGSGMDDVCVFVTTNGEIAVYEGDDPSDASTWGLIGVYDIAPPLNKHSYFKAGGDLAILTDDGIISMSAALKQDRAALQASAISAPIEDAWKSAVANATTAFPITPTLWQAQAMLVIGVPGSEKVAFVANARTGAWCRYTGWDVRCGGVSNGNLYFGTNAGVVMRGENGGHDASVQYTGTYVPKFTDAQSGEKKVMNHAGLTFKASGVPAFKITGMVDFDVRDQTPPPAMDDAASGSTWGTGVWGTFMWGTSADTQTYTRWKAVSGAGYYISPAVYVTSNQSTAPIFEILASRVRFETARAL